MSVGEMAGFFRDENLLHLLHGDNLKKIITSFRYRVDAKEILLGGSVPPSCDETNILTHRYDLTVYHQLYPTNEQVKILTDAKYFFAIACGGGFCDEGLTKAVAEAANIILIADY